MSTVFCVLTVNRILWYSLHMETRPPVSAAGRFGQHVASAMQEQNINSAAELARRLGISREHTRRLLMGLTSPSQALCKLLCQLLKIDFNVLWQQCQEDRFQRKFGRKIASRVTKDDDPRIEQCRDMLLALTPVQYQAVLSVLRGFTKSTG